jgi:hypothetical protein
MFKNVTISKCPGSEAYGTHFPHLPDDMKSKVSLSEEDQAKVPNVISWDPNLEATGVDRSSGTAAALGP